MAAAVRAALRSEPMVAKSVAAEVISSGAAITNDIPTSNQYSDGPIATASVIEKQIVGPIHSGRLANSHRSFGQFTTDRMPNSGSTAGCASQSEASESPHVYGRMD